MVQPRLSGEHLRVMLAATTRLCPRALTACGVRSLSGGAHHKGEAAVCVCVCTVCACVEGGGKLPPFCGARLASIGLLVMPVLNSCGVGALALRPVCVHLCVWLLSGGAA